MIRQLHEKDLTTIKEAVVAFDRDLDDLARARIEARIGAELERLAEPRTVPRLQLRWAAMGLAAAACAALVVVMYPREPAHVAFEPVLVAGFEATPDLRQAMLGAGVDQINVPEGGVVRAAVGDEGIIELRGVASASTLQPKDGVALTLDRGLILAEVERRPERAFRIVHQDFVVEVVGTRFLVDARDFGRPAVAVVAGAVRIELMGRESAIRLVAGQGWRRGVGAGAIEPEHAELLRTMETKTTARSGGAPSGVLLVRGAEGMQVALADRSPLGRAPLWARLPTGPIELNVAHGERALLARAEVPAEAIGTLQVELDTLPEPKSDPQPSEPPRAEESQNVRPAVPDSAEARYRLAEDALRRRDFARATRELEELVRRFPKDSLAATALFELARMANDARQIEQTHAYLDRLLARGADPALEESAVALRCRLRSEETDLTQAIACWSDFRERFPSSSRDRAVLRALVGLADRAGDCNLARPWLEELIRRYPYAADELRAEERLARCAR